MTRPTWAEVQVWHHNKHGCPGLPCTTHPRWHVFKSGYWWWVDSPQCRTFKHFPTWAEALAYAHQQARKDTK